MRRLQINLQEKRCVLLRTQGTRISDGTLARTQKNVPALHRHNDPARPSKGKKYVTGYSGGKLRPSCEKKKKKARRGGETDEDPRTVDKELVGFKQSVP